MSDSIRISPKYGLNPTLPVCFFCGETKQEVALLGKIGKGKQDLEAPKYAVLDYVPCDSCQEKMSQGILFICCSTNQPEDKRPPINNADNKVVYPLDEWVVITRDATKRIFNFDEDHPVMERGVCLLDEEIFNNVFRKEN